MIGSYLKKNLQRWKEDKSHAFGMYALGVALWSHLKDTGWQLELRNELNAKLPEIASALDEPFFKPKPEGTYPPKWPKSNDGKVRSVFFPPYYGLWRMERSNALMFLPLLVSKDGSTFLRINELSESIIGRLGLAFNQLLNEIKDTDNPETGLIGYFNTLESKLPQKDWGLSAEFLALLELPAVIQLILDTGRNESFLREKSDTLRNSLVDTLADYPKYRQVFRYSHGLSCGSFLSSGISTRVCPEDVEALDKCITHAHNHFSTEMELYGLAKAIYRYAPVSEGMPNFSAEYPQDAKYLTALFVEKLLSGEHSEDLWDEKRHKCTIAFFDSENAKKFYISRYGEDNTHDTLITRIENVSGNFEDGPKLALDLGCGAGQCAKWLFEHGFSVHLVDDSKEMIALAKATMKNSLEPSTQNNKYEFHKLDAKLIHTHFANVKFNLIVANALLVHISPRHAGELFAKIYDLLVPNGRFFVNFKLRDHTLISMDNRYFAYYRESSVPEAMLRHAGFQIDEIALRLNNKTLYDVPMSILWANFYCRRPG